MTEVKLKLEDNEIIFLHQCKKFGFKDEESMVSAALESLRKEMENTDLKNSADLYAELYKEDQELRTITESSLTGWPE